MNEEEENEDKETEDFDRNLAKALRLSMEEERAKHDFFFKKETLLKRYMGMSMENKLAVIDAGDDNDNKCYLFNNTTGLQFPGQANYVSIIGSHEK